MRLAGHINGGSLGVSLAIYGYSDSARLGVALALRLAREHPGRLKIEVLARSTGSTYASTGRALRLLAAGRVARSTRGPRGGWRLSKPASCIKLIDVLEPFRCGGESHHDGENGYALEMPGGKDRYPLDSIVSSATAAAAAELAGITLAGLLGDVQQVAHVLPSAAELQPAF